jgi:hypothetical protein
LRSKMHCILNIERDHPAAASANWYANVTQPVQA